jgi:hypothetical protein
MLRSSRRPDCGKRSATAVGRSWRSCKTSLTGSRPALPPEGRGAAQSFAPLRSIAHSRFAGSTLSLPGRSRRGLMYRQLGHSSPMVTAAPAARLPTTRLATAAAPADEVTCFCGRTSLQGLRCQPVLLRRDRIGLVGDVLFLGRRLDADGRYGRERLRLLVVTGCRARALLADRAAGQRALVGTLSHQRRRCRHC